MNDTTTRVRYEGRNRSHASAYYVILITVSCTGDYEHPYYDYAANPEYAEEGTTDESTLPSEI